MYVCTRWFKPCGKLFIFDIADCYQALAQCQNVLRKANIPRVDLLSSTQITALRNLIKSYYAVIMVNDDLRIGQGIWKLSHSNIHPLRHT